MKFRDKIDNILTIKQIKLWKLAEISGLGNTLEKAYEENREMRKAQTDKLLQNVSINPDWWEDQKGAVIIEKSYNVDKASDNKEKAPESVYRDLVESNSEYRLIPKIILDQYEIIPKRELEERAEIVKVALQAKDYAIAQLEKEIAQLRSVQLVHTKEAQ